MIVPTAHETARSVWLYDATFHIHSFICCFSCGHRRLRHRSGHSFCTLTALCEVLWATIIPQLASYQNLARTAHLYTTCLAPFGAAVVAMVRSSWPGSNISSVEMTYLHERCCLACPLGCHRYSCGLHFSSDVLVLQTVFV